MNYSLFPSNRFYFREFEFRKTTFHSVETRHLTGCQAGVPDSQPGPVLCMDAFPDADFYLAWPLGTSGGA